MIGSGCHREDADGSVPTETIAPATPPAASATGTETDTALTQTIEIGEERSASEGGGLSVPAAATTPATSSKAPSTPSRPAARPKK